MELAELAPEGLHMEAAEPMEVAEKAEAAGFADELFTAAAVERQLELEFNAAAPVRADSGFLPPPPPPMPRSTEAMPPPPPTGEPPGASASPLRPVGTPLASTPAPAPRWPPLGNLEGTPGTSRTATATPSPARGPAFRWPPMAARAEDPEPPRVPVDLGPEAVPWPQPEESEGPQPPLGPPPPEDKGEPPTFLSEVISTVCGGLRGTVVPSMLALVVGVGLVTAYYAGGDSVRASFNAVAKLQEEWGIMFSIISTCIAGGILPMLVQVHLAKLPEPICQHVFFNIIYWGFIGALVWALYHVNALINGEEPNATTVVRKVFFDQFVVNPFFLYPFVFLPLFRWRDLNFSCRRWRASLDRRGLGLQYCSMMTTMWCTWIPGTSVVYSFPTALQIPIFTVICFFFSVLISLVSARSVQSGSKGGASDDLDEASEAQRRTVARHGPDDFDPVGPRV